MKHFLSASVYDFNNRKVGDGFHIQLLSLTTTTSLDEIGAFTFSVPVADPRSFTMEQKKRVVIEWFDPIQGVRKEVANGYIEDIRYSDSGRTLVVRCVDILTELGRRVVGINRRYMAVPIGTVIQQLAEEGGWSAIVLESDNVVGRFSGLSLYAAILEINKRFKYHLRRSISQARIIECGEFGDHSGVTVKRFARMTDAIQRRNDVAILGNITIQETSKQIVNRIYPFGGGSAKAQLTLQKATAGYPYSVQSIRQNDGTVLYYLEDRASIDAYGLHEAMLTFSNIADVDPAPSLQIEAANNLYYRAAAYLQLYSISQVAYQFNCYRLPDHVQIGSKVRLTYHDWADRRQNGAVVPQSALVDVDNDFWITSIDRAWNEDGSVLYTVEASNVDRRPTTDEDIIASQIREANVERTLANPITRTAIYSVSSFGDIKAAWMSPSYPPQPATLTIKLPDDVIELESIVLGVETPETSMYRYNGTYATGTIFRWSFFFNGKSLIPLGLKDLLRGDEALNAPEAVGDQAVVGVGYNEQTFGVVNVPGSFRFDLTEWIKDAGISNTHTIEIINYNRFGVAVTDGEDSFGEVKFLLEMKYTTIQDNIVR